VTEILIKLRVLRRCLVRQWCAIAGHYWWVDERGVHCARCGMAGR